MKTLLGCLMCSVLTMSQAFAISGGPFGGGGGRVAVTGIYAGVFVPKLTVIDPGPPPVTLPPDDSLGLFTLTIPSKGLATGTVVIFRNGIAYNGNIQGSADPDTAKLTGVLDADFLLLVETITNSSGTTLEVVAAEDDAKGKFDGTKIVNQTSLGIGSTRIKGTASITYTQSRFDGNPNDPNAESGGPIAYKVKGFKQASQ